MRIKFSNDFTTPGGRHYKAGTAVEMDNAAARNLIARGKATAVPSGRTAGRQTQTDGGHEESAPAETSATADTTNPTGEKGKE